jgi:hypothetical protein
VLADRFDLRGLGQEGAHHRFVAVVVQAKVAERIGMAAFDDGIGLGGQLVHEASSSKRI